MRVLVRVLAVLSGLVLSVAGALLGLEVLWAWLDPDTAGLLVPWAAIRSTLTTTSWSDAPVRWAAVSAVASGLLLLLVVIRSGPGEIPLRGPATDVTGTTDARSLARLIGNRVREQAEVTTASVVATGKRVRVAATSRASDLDEVRGRVIASAEQAVRGLPLRDVRDISVAVRRVKEHR